MRLAHAVRAHGIAWIGEAGECVVAFADVDLERRRSLFAEVPGSAGTTHGRCLSTSSRLTPRLRGVRWLWLE